MIFDNDIDRMCHEHQCSGVIVGHRVQLDGEIAIVYATDQSDFYVLINQPSLYLGELLELLPTHISSLIVDSDDYCWVVDSSDRNIKRFEIIECCYLDIHVGNSFGGMKLYRNNSPCPSDTCRLTIQNWIQNMTQTLYDLEIHHDSTVLSVQYDQLDNLKFDNFFIGSQSLQLELNVNVDTSEDTSFVNKYNVELFLARMLRHTQERGYNVKHITVWVQSEKMKLNAWAVEPSHLMNFYL